MTLYYYGHRFYSPGIGRWLSRDPIGERNGPALYEFVLNNPLYWVDPDGLAPQAAEPGLIMIKFGDLPGSASDLADIGVDWQNVKEQYFVKGCRTLADGSKRCGYAFTWKFKCENCEKCLVQHVKKKKTYYKADGTLINYSESDEFVEGWRILENQTTGLDAHTHAGNVPVQVPVSTQPGQTQQVQATKRCVHTDLVSCCGTYDGQVVTAPAKYKKWPNSAPSKIKCTGPTKTVTFDFCYDKDGNTTFTSSGIPFP